MLRRSKACTSRIASVAEVSCGSRCAQRQRQPRVIEPPLARIDDQLQPLVGVCQLPLVDNQSRVDAPPFILPGRYSIENLVERHKDVIEIDAKAEPQGQIRRGSQSRHGDRRAAQFVERHAPFGDDHRTIPVAHACPARTENVAMAEEGIGVDADRRQLQIALERTLVERLDVDQLVRKPIPARVDLALRQGIEHESVVGIGTMAHADCCTGWLIGFVWAITIESLGKRYVGAAGSGAAKDLRRNVMPTEIPSLHSQDDRSSIILAMSCILSERSRLRRLSMPPRRSAVAPPCDSPAESPHRPPGDGPESRPVPRFPGEPYRLEYQRS